MPSPRDPDLIRNTKALEEATRTLKNATRLAEAINTNLIELHKLMTQNQENN